MNTKIKLLITVLTGMYFFTGCNDGTTTTTDKENTDITKMSNMNTDTVTD